MAMEPGGRASTTYLCCGGQGRRGELRPMSKEAGLHGKQHQGGIKIHSTELHRQQAAATAQPKAGPAHRPALLTSGPRCPAA